mgnify:CR=1 FL=1
MKKIKTGFTLIENLFAIGILAIIAILLLPSLNTLVVNSNNLRDSSSLIFAMEEAIELEKANTNPSYGDDFKIVNGFDIKVTRQSYSNSLDKISVSHGKFNFEVIEENNEEKRLYSN